MFDIKSKNIQIFQLEYEMNYDIFSIQNRLKLGQIK